MKHHYLSAAYLRGFLDPATPEGQTPYVWIADFDSNTIDHKAPKNIAHITDHNVVFDTDGQPSHAVEGVFSEIESSALPVIRRIVSGERDIDDGAFRALNAFIALQMVRVPSVRERLEDFFLGAAKKLGMLMTRDAESFKRDVRRLHPELTNTAAEGVYEFARDPNNYELSVHSSRALSDALTLAEKAEPMLAQMTWLIVAADAPVFVTCDNPVCLVNPKADSWNFGHGLAHVNTEVTFPLSPTVCYWGVWDAAPGTTISTEAAPQQIEAINLRTVILAAKQCYASNQVLAESALAIRKRARGRTSEGE